MMDIYKVLEILNSGEYVKIEKHFSSYTVTLKEGGMIRITQLLTIDVLSDVAYKISLFVPSEDKSIECWTFSKYSKGLLLRTIKDPLYDEVSLTYDNLYDEYRKKKINEHSKYFPQ